MIKSKFSEIINDGLNRNKSFMVVKIKQTGAINPTIIIVQSDDILRVTCRYMKLTDANMTFEDSGDQIIDVLMTSNLNDLSWFAY